MSKYDFIKCTNCGEPLNKIIYGLRSRGELPKHSVVFDCRKSEYAFECSNHDCKKKYTFSEVYKPHLFSFIKPKLREEFCVGFDKDWDKVVKERLEKLKQNFNLILDEIACLEPNSEFSFSNYFKKYDIPKKEHFNFYHNLLDLLGGSVEVKEQMQNAVVGLPFNILHIKNEKQVYVFNPQNEESVSKMLELLTSEKLYETVYPQQSNGITTMGYISYDERLIRFLKTFAYYENEKSLDIKELKSVDFSTLTINQVKLYLVSIFRAEKLCDGLISSFVDNKIIEKLLTRYLELIKSKG